MKPNTRVNRIQSTDPKGATIVQVHFDTVLLAYDEGGQGWWPINSMEPLTTANWPRFKAHVLTNPDINAALATALTTVPAAATALAPTLLRAEQGDPSDFAAAWAAVMQAAPLAPETLAELVSLARECELPEVFVASFQAL